MATRKTGPNLWVVTEAVWSFNGKTEPLLAQGPWAPGFVADAR